LSDIPGRKPTTIQNERDVIIRYLEDAIAAERAFETQLRGFANEGDEPEASRMFAKHADETRTRHQLLSERLNSLGATPSGMKSFLANMLALAPKTAQIGYDESERMTQNLIMAFSVETARLQRTKPSHSSRSPETRKPNNSLAPSRSRSRRPRKKSGPCCPPSRKEVIANWWNPTQ
jgi:Domain of unknown function (DUF892)